MNTQTQLSTSLNTAEDYVSVCENFVLPLFAEQSKKIVAVIQQLQKELEKGEFKQERINFFINQILEYSSFAKPDSPMNPYFMQLIKLEEKLEKGGKFDDPKSSSN